jgi:hypothetical protein
MEINLIKIKDLILQNSKQKYDFIKLGCLINDTNLIPNVTDPLNTYLSNHVYNKTSDFYKKRNHINPQIMFFP